MKRKEKESEGEENVGEERREEEREWKRTEVRIQSSEKRAGIR